MNRKLTAILLAALMMTMAACGALAATANATVVAPETVKITAPMNGTPERIRPAGQRNAGSCGSCSSEP